MRLKTPVTKEELDLECPLCHHKVRQHFWVNGMVSYRQPGHRYPCVCEAPAQQQDPDKPIRWCDCTYTLDVIHDT